MMAEKKPVLVMLAAGVGSRYGGLKQMDKFGRHGEVLLDYSAFDALRSGFGKVVFIIRHDIEKDFRELVLARMEGKVNYEIAFQELDSLIPPEMYQKATAAGRTKPWGTAHALLCAKDCIDAPFAVMNSDDFYGRTAFTEIGAFLSQPNLAESAIVPYKLEPTLSPMGTVARGVCVIENGYMTQIEELTKIEKKDGAIFNTNDDGTRQNLPAHTPVSMNFWGFPETVMPHLQAYFDNFVADWLAAETPAPQAECYLPKAAGWFVQQGYTKIKALPTATGWFGVTYKEDRADAVQKLADLTAKGEYPEALWGQV
jgi:hypothetical protein